MRFEPINDHKSLNFLLGDSPDDLLNQLRAITLPTHIVSIYAVGNKHVAWFKTDAKIIKKPRASKVEVAQG